MPAIIEYAKRTLPRDQSFEGLRVVVDCANGAAYRVAPDALWELGAEVISMGVEPDGLNINRDVGSTSPAALSAKVREVRADVGIALDGDADRVIIVDEKGHVVDGDQIMAVVAHSFKEDGRLSRDGIVATVMSNLGLERYLKDEGLTLARTSVGDRYVLERMRSDGYNVGGEQSGHIILSDYSTTGDGLLAALQVLAVVARSERPCRRSATASTRATGAQERALFLRQAAGARERPERHCRCRAAARQSRPTADPSLRHRTRHPRDGRGR